MSIFAKKTQKWTHFNFLYLIWTAAFFPDKTVPKECRKKKTFLPLSSYSLLPAHITKDRQICFFEKNKKNKRKNRVVFKIFFQNDNYVNELLLSIIAKK